MEAQAVSDLTSIYPLGFAGITFLLWFFLWRKLDADVRYPLALYCAIYVVTTLLGASLIALSNGDILSQLNYGVDLRVLTDLGSLTYWSLLFAPLIVPLLWVLLFSKNLVAEEIFARVLPHFRDRLTIASLLVTFTGLASYCILDLYWNGYLGSLLTLVSFRGDYLSIIVLRAEMISTLGSSFFGIAYIALPTLSQCALYQYAHTRSWAWQLAFIFTLLVTAFLCISTIQKSLVLIYLFFLGIGLAELKVIRWWTLGIVLTMIILLLTVMQSFFLEDWDIWRSLDLITFRLASSYPYYVRLYPDVLPYIGIDWGSHLIGLGEPPADSLDVFDYMYPGITWVQGSTPAAAHIRAYAQAGPLFAVVTLALIGFLLTAIGGLRRRIKGPLTYALYMQTLVLLYYLTQTSLREAVLSCYGIFWACVALVCVWVVRDLEGGLVTADYRGW
jgi:hypothetical protein